MEAIFISVSNQRWSLGIPHVSGVRSITIISIHACLFLLITACSAHSAKAEKARATITLISSSPARVRVEGQLEEETKVWEFVDEYAGIANLSQRLSDLAVLTPEGVGVPIHKKRAGAFESEIAAKDFRYEVDLSPPQNPLDAAHVSWLTPERGVLMVGELLPRLMGRACLRLSLPESWEALTLEQRSAAGCFDIQEVDRSVIWVGRETREVKGRGRSMLFTLAVEGTWAFADDDVAKAISAIIKEHESATSATPREHTLVIVAPFPRAVSAQRWVAETRGGTVVLLSGAVPSKHAGLSRLSLALIHELFHLWVPNGLNFSGNYDWFYEGFTLYHSTRVGVQLGYLTFPEFLDALARAYDNYSSQPVAGSLSLLDASRQRWRGAETDIYNRGLIVAFLCDLAIRRQPDKYTLNDVYRDLFRVEKNNPPSRDGGAVILGTLKRFTGDSVSIERLFRSSDRLNLKQELGSYGLQVETGGPRTHINVAHSLSRSQYDFLKKIGYNDRVTRLR